MKRIILVVLSVSLFVVTQTTQAQRYTSDEQFEVAFGLGYLDLLHAGMKYKLTPVNKIAMSYGGLFNLGNSERKRSSITLEHQYHFGKTTFHSKSPIFYFSQKLTMLRDNNSTYNTQMVYVTPSIGKSFYGDGPYGINVDIGVMAKIHDYGESFGNIPEQQNRPKYPAFFPAIRFQFFFSL
ncbi:hypothetical protein R9C00_22705 [Flammeovirgaceae bacterium SG7u.111]|nr:hypothetical protein [Flammeovirgaceae bacterium SG7u.132]WPO34515.1 hypothetical protein R9C00_22705 [Flammeovirgaceae bacterium SG7u.111]